MHELMLGILNTEHFINRKNQKHDIFYYIWLKLPIMTGKKSFRIPAILKVFMHNFHVFYRNFCDFKNCLGKTITPQS